MSFENAQKVMAKPLDKAQQIKYSSLTTETEQLTENESVSRFCEKRTLTTEEWKAELELEQCSVSCASVSVPVNYELYSFTRVKNNLRTSQANMFCSLDRA